MESSAGKGARACWGPALSSLGWFVYRWTLFPIVKAKPINLETARQRLAGLKKITNSDFGAGMNPTDYGGDITALTVKLDDYNGLLAAIDEAQNDLQKMEIALRDKNARILSAVEARFGSDSNEYEMVGGTRRSERKKPAKKKSGDGSPTTK